MSATNTQKNPRSPFLIPILIGLALAALTVFLLARLQSPRLPETAPSRQNDSPPLPSSQANTGGTSTVQSTIPPVRQGEPLEELTPPPSCEQIEKDILSFLNTIETREYYNQYEIKGKFIDYANGMLTRLLAHPPMVAREADSFSSIMANTIHFYRILGAHDLDLAKDIMASEQDAIESFLAALNDWRGLSSTCSQKTIPFQMPLPSMYDYAGFFIHTLGGQSYLFRRTPRLRLLMKYYSLLILDEANTKGLNRHALDLRRPLEATIAEMEASSELTGRERYATRLRVIRSRLGDNVRR